MLVGHGRRGAILIVSDILDDWSDRLEGFDRIMECLVLGLVVFMPLAFGAVEAWSQEVVLVLTAGLSICFVLRLLLAREAFVVRTWTYVPILLFILAVTVQLVPMPTGLIRLISANTAARKMELLGDLFGAQVNVSHLTLSFYPYITRYDLRLVLAVATVFVVVLNIYRRPEQIKRLLVAITVVGAGVALLALAQTVAGNGRIYWLVSVPKENAFAGTFANHSHFAQFVNLSMGAALALILMEIHEVFDRRRVTPAMVADYMGSPQAKVFWALLLAMVLGSASIFVSLSRGGAISLLVAGTFTALAISSKKALKGSAWVMVLLALGAFLCVLYVGFNAVYERLETLSDMDAAEGGRWQMLADVAVAWMKFPILGTGLGTHAVVYPEFDRSTIPALATHVENEYAQAAEETGILGLGCLIAFGALVWTHYGRNVRAGGLPIRSAAFGLGFGLVAILVHSLSDFGQHVPANACLTAIFCALMVRIWHMGPQGEMAGSCRARRRTHLSPTWIVVVLVVCGLWGWALSEADAARRGDAHWRRAMAVESTLMEADRQVSNEPYIDLIRAAQNASGCQPGNIKYRHWLNVYRWNAISYEADPNTGDLFLPPTILEFVERIVAEQRQALRLCPTFGPTWCVMGQLENTILGDSENGVRHIERGRELAPCDATVCLVMGTLFAERGEQEAAFQEWHRAVELDERLFSEVARKCTAQLNRPDLALHLAGQNSGRLSRLAGILSESDEESELIVEVNRRILTLLEEESRQPDAQAWALAPLAELYRREGRVEEAIDLYRRALALDYGRIQWRFRLAVLLVEGGLREDAIGELETCLRLRPEFLAARSLLDELSVRHDAEVSLR